MSKKMLMACRNYWSSPFQVGSHQIAKGFVNIGYHVAFLSDPISPLHLLYTADDSFSNRFSIYQKGGIWDYHQKVWTYIPGAIAVPYNIFLLRSKWLYKNWYKLTFPNAIEVVKKNGFEKVDFIYLDSVNQSFWLDKITHNKSIYRFADNLAGYPNASSVSIEQERKLAQRVDLVVYCAKGLESYIKKLKPKNSIYLPNGVNFEHFTKRSTTIPKKLLNIKKPIAIYAGSLDKWFDFHLVNYLACELPDISFVLIGPKNLAKRKIAKLPNLFILDKCSYNELPSFLQNADIGIIPYDIKNHQELINYFNPLKLYQYLACNLPVVSVRTQELELLNTPAILTNTYQEFKNAIVDLIEKNKSQDIDGYINRIRNLDWNLLVKRLNDTITSI